MDTIGTFSRVLVAVDDSPHAVRALQVGARLAASLGARLGVVHAIDVRSAIMPEVGIASEQILQGLRGAGQFILENARERVRSEHPDLESNAEFAMIEGGVSDAIVDFAKSWKASLIVVGTHGRSGLSRLLLGSTAEQIVRHVKIPALVVPLE